MTAKAIEIINLSKKYYLGSLGTASLKDLFLRQNRPAVWALQDVSLEIERGSVTGILGRNGAGKSTLLKILTGITKPSLGKAVVRGQVSSMLEVGTGFHPELTGRENVYLNGTILGMRKREIDRKLDEIVQFSEVEKFLDTPVKRYSSGMYVRLAFSIAAHLEPDILLVDEVLSVGDFNFQKKCIKKIKQICREGRTVLFVSHSLETFEQLCDQAILLEKGRVDGVGDTKEMIQKYLSNAADMSQGTLSKDSGIVRSIQVENFENRRQINALFGGNLKFLVELQSDKRIDHPMLSIGIKTLKGDRVATIHSTLHGNETWFIDGKNRVSACWEDINLMPGEYTLSVDLWTKEDGYLDIMSDTHALRIEAANTFNHGKAFNAELFGYLFPKATWKLK